MQIYHDQTDINYKKYFNQANFIDYRTQPKAYKKYPHFYQRFHLDDYEELKFIKNIGKIIEIYFINNNIDSLTKGLYKNVILQKEGDFKEIATTLALNQKLSGQSAFTLIFTCKANHNYFYSYILSGFISQILYLKTSSLNLSCSGLGAYFDLETKEFLETKNNIFYLFAIGK